MCCQVCINITFSSIRHKSPYYIAKMQGMGTKIHRATQLCVKSFYVFTSPCEVASRNCIVNVINNRCSSSFSVYHFATKCAFFMAKHGLAGILLNSNSQANNSNSRALFYGI